MASYFCKSQFECWALFLSQLFFLTLLQRPVCRLILGSRVKARSTLGSRWQFGKINLAWGLLMPMALENKANNHLSVCFPNPPPHTHSGYSHSGGNTKNREQLLAKIWEPPNPIYLKLNTALTGSPAAHPLRLTGFWTVVQAHEEQTDFLIISTTVFAPL